MHGRPAVVNVFAAHAMAKVNLARLHAACFSCAQKYMQTTLNDCTEQQAVQ